VEEGADAARDTPTDARPDGGGETTNPPGVQISLVPALSRGAAVRFAITFAVLCGVLLGLYYFPYSEGGRVRPVLDGFLHRYAASAGVVLRWFEPHVQVIGQDIIGRYSLRIVKTCDAMDVTILLTSAIVAWPGPWKRRLVGAAAGIALLFVVNVLRICTLYWIGSAFPSLFEVAHLDLWPALILIVSIGFFAIVAAGGREVRTEGSREPA
jgi:exosortase/archaeosortase family protein